MSAEALTILFHVIGYAGAVAGSGSFFWKLANWLHAANGLSDDEIEGAQAASKIGRAKRVAAAVLDLVTHLQQPAPAAPVSPAAPVAPAK